jgi:tetratricopeptide (TPR) repeat protein
VLGVALVGWALLRAADQPPELGSAGADVVLALDVSHSMNSRDTAPSRLRRAMRLAERVAGEADAVRLGLVLFAGDAFVALPLTQDWDAVLTYLGSLDTELISVPGTDLSRALDSAVSVFDPRSSRPRQIVLFSDGEDGGRGLEEALARARAARVRVVPVGFGTPEGGEVLIRGGDALRDEQGDVVHSRRADVLLRRVAAATQGTYYREIEDHPAPGRLLPEPAPDREERASPAPAGLVAALALAVLLLGAEMLLSVRWPTRFGWGELVRGRAAALPAAALVALAGTALGPWSLEREGDRLLEQGEPRQALSIYRKVERASGPTARSRIRVGNALYRLGQSERAVAAYLSVLQRFGGGDPSARFVAAYNMGTALLAQQRYAEARDALWTALLENPDSFEAKFNYEWALEHAPPEEEPPLPPMPQPSEAPASQSQQSGASGEGAQREREVPLELSEAEAERWLRAIQESPGEALRRQIGDSLGDPGSRRERRQTW